MTLEEDMEMTGKGQVGISRVLEIFCLDLQI